MQPLVASGFAGVFAAFLGAIGWTFIEYVLHRFVFHGKSAKSLGAREHRQHHAQVDYFAPWWQKGLAALAATSLMLPLSVAAQGLVLGLSFTSGFVAMYIVYEILHRRAHTHAPTNAYGRWLRRNHFAHHFADPRRAQGVSTPVWDFVIGTRLPIERVRVPRRLAMPWLIDEHGVLRPSYADEYLLVGSARRDDRTRKADAAAAMANRSPNEELELPGERGFPSHPPSTRPGRFQ